MVSMVVNAWSLTMADPAPFDNVQRQTLEGVSFKHVFEACCLGVKRSDWIA